MAGLGDRLRYMRGRGQKLGKFATVCSICQWEMQVGSKLKTALTRAHRQLTLLFLCFGILLF